MFFTQKGLSPDLHDLDQIRSINRPTEVLDAGLLCDLLWSDPDKETNGWGPNDRGVSFTFGADVVTKFLNKHNLDLVCRAHQARSVMSSYIYIIIARNCVACSPREVCALVILYHSGIPNQNYVIVNSLQVVLTQYFLIYF